MLFDGTWRLLTTDYMNLKAVQAERNRTIGHHEGTVIQAAWMVEQLLGRPIFGSPNATGRPRSLSLRTPHTLSHTPKLLHKVIGTAVVTS